MVDGNITDDPRNIAKFFAKFYSDLYTSKLSPKHMNYFSDVQNVQCWGASRNMVGNHCYIAFSKHGSVWNPIKNVLLLLQAEEPFSGTV